jgi:hypothetical protein
MAGQQSTSGAVTSASSDGSQDFLFRQSSIDKRILLIPGPQRKLLDCPNSWYSAVINGPHDSLNVPPAVLEDIRNFESNKNRKRKRDLAEGIGQTLGRNEAAMSTKHVNGDSSRHSLGSDAQNCQPEEEEEERLSWPSTPPRPAPPRESAATSPLSPKRPHLLNGDHAGSSRAAVQVTPKSLVQNGNQRTREELPKLQPQLPRTILPIPSFPSTPDTEEDLELKIPGETMSSGDASSPTTRSQSDSPARIQEMASSPPCGQDIIPCSLSDAPATPSEKRRRMKALKITGGPSRKSPPKMPYFPPTKRARLAPLNTKGLVESSLATSALSSSAIITVPTSITKIETSTGPATNQSQQFPYQMEPHRINETSLNPIAHSAQKVSGIPVMSWEDADRIEEARIQCTHDSPADILDIYSKERETSVLSQDDALRSEEPSMHSSPSPVAEYLLEFDQTPKGLGIAWEDNTQIEEYSVQSSPSPLTEILERYSKAPEAPVMSQQIVTHVEDDARMEDEKGVENATQMKELTRMEDVSQMKGTSQIEEVRPRSPPADILDTHSKAMEAPVLNQKDVTRIEETRIPPTPARPGTIFDRYNKAYPSYPGSLGDFVRACMYLKVLRRNRALSSFLFDDFIRIFSKDYLAYISEIEVGEKPLTGIEWYNETVKDPEFTQSIVTRQSLDSVFESYPEQVRVARESLGSSQQSQQTSTEKASNHTETPEAPVQPKAANTNTGNKAVRNRLELSTTMDPPSTAVSKPTRVGPMERSVKIPGTPSSTAGWSPASSYLRHLTTPRRVTKSAAKNDREERLTQFLRRRRQSGV